MERGITAGAELRELKRMHLHSGAFVGVAVWCFLAASAATASEGHPAFYPADAVRGGRLALGCLACHGATAIIASEGAFHVPRLRGQRPSSIFDALIEYKNGSRHNETMAGLVATLSEQDMRDVAAYLGGAEIRPTRDPVPDSWAHARVHDDCAACHGETGLGVMPGYPVLGGQFEDYLIHALQAFRNGERKNPTMNAMARQLSDDEIDQLARYFAERGYLQAAQ